MNLKPHDILALFKSTFQEWKEDKAAKMAAALAYYAVFSLGPILLIALTVASFFFNEETAKTQMMGEISKLIGESTTQTIAAMLQNIRQKQPVGITAVVSLSTLLFAASGVFGELQDSLNQIWEIKRDESSGVGALVRRRLLSFGMVFSIGFLLLVSLILTSMLEAFLRFAGDLIPGSHYVWQFVSFGFSFGLITVLFACTYRYLPDAKIAWRDLWIGSAITAAFFTVGKFGISLYLAHSATASAFGAAASIVLLLLWIYYSAQIFFFGAEFTQVYAKNFGLGMALNAGAVRTEKKQKFYIRKDDHVKSINPQSKKMNSGIKTFDDAINKIQEAEQPLKNELFKQKLTFTNLMKAKKYYIVASTVLGVISYFYRQYRRRRHAEAH